MAVVCAPSDDVLLYKLMGTCQSPRMRTQYPSSIVLSHQHQQVRLLLCVAVVVAVVAAFIGKT